MAWTFWQPAKPTNLTGSLVAGGSLAANTTYYFKVYAWDMGNTTTTRYALNQSSNQIYSPYSDTFSITTDAVNKSVALSWDMVLKRNGVTQVDAYEVIMSTADDFDTAQDDAKLFPADVGYFNPATNTNSFTVTKLPTATAYTKNIKDGIPYCIWDGATASCTFKSLYDALAADPYYNIFAKKITSFNDPNNILGYEFMATIYITRHTGDSVAGVYTFESIGDLIINFGGFNCGGCKYNVRNSYLFFAGSTHAGGMNVFGSPVAGSFLMNTLLRYTIGTTPNAKSWGDMGQNYAPFINANVTSSNNVYQNWTQTADNLSLASNIIAISPYYRGTDAAAQTQNTQPYRDDSVVATQWTYYFNQASTGTIKKITTSGKYGWFSYNSKIFGYDITNNLYEYFQGGQCSFIDCIWRYRNFTGISDGDGWNPRIKTDTIYGPHLKNSLFYFGKTIFLTVKDKDGNPIEGATVKFENANGTNVTRGNAIANVCKVGGSVRSSGNNWDTTETTITHDDEDIWLKEVGTYDGGIVLPTVGNTYWYGAEKITILSRDAAASAWDASTHHYTATRGVDGTPSGWILSANATYDNRLVTAPDSLVTNANGQTFNMTVFKVYKFLNIPRTDFLTNYLANGWATEYDWGPIKVTVSAPGKQTKIYYISDDYAIAMGTTPINLEVNMDSQVSTFTLIGDDVKQVLNAKPSDTSNGILLDVIV